MTFPNFTSNDNTVVSSTGVQVATEPMFGGRDLSDVSGPNGLSGPDLSDFAFVAGSTAAGGWAAIPREASGGSGRLTDMKEQAVQNLTERHQQATTDRDDARKWSQAEKDGTLDAKVRQQTADEIKPIAEQARKDAVADHLKAAGPNAANPEVQKEADKAGKLAAKKAAADAEKALGKKIATRAAEMAAKKSAMLVAKQAGLRAAALAAGAAIPGPGWLVAAGFLVGSLMIDPQMRNMITGIFSSGMDANQPPAPPTTTWLPATDDNRQNDIRQADVKLAALNEHISGIDPGSHRLWHLQDSQVPALTNMSAGVAKLNAATAKAAEASGNYEALLNSAPDQWGEKLKAARRSSAQVIADFGPKAGVPMAAALTAAASAGNDAYQQVREGNAKARQQLANSHGRFLGFIGGGYGADNLSANIPAIEDAARGVAEADNRIAEAVKDWNTAAVRANRDDVVAADGFAADRKASQVNGKPEEEPRLEPNPITTPSKGDIDDPLPKPDPTPPQGLNNPLAPLASPPNMGGMGPLGGNPFGGGGPAAGPKPLADIMSNLPEPPKKKDAGEIRDDVLPKDTEKDGKKGKLDGELPGESKPGPKIVPAADTPPEQRPGLGRPGPVPPTTPSAVVNIPGVGPVDFKDPKIAELVQKITGAEDGAPVTVRAGAQELGIPIGEPGKDIGPVVQPGELKPGHIVSSADGKDYIYIGEDQVLGEDKKVYPLSKVAVFDSNTDGLFRLDTGFQPDQPAPPADAAAQPNLAAAAPAPAGGAAPAEPQPVIVPADPGPSGTPPVDPPPPGSVPGQAPIDPKNILP
ncbi:hypothetical protein H7J87_11815 [Mycolicibacterium wolinskyi]|uniref:Uncharacterized protein n=1 Tax=Mycolicibacterium wolinskyi TaxID=59750 RepID=A0A1X2FJ28_9MYCO|nr:MULTISPECIES: hypothetical protein [Mycolicibacterium]MCV7286017.1 hypothetical protein [Mycolicibacterium wolinskyi]MCV7296213.1 hypothetical protein [Mycolicibacterium goodii]ORX18445.1 hypothetical protein AWC31_14170 [Mycolicibacterium wolinskyi]